MGPGSGVLLVPAVGAGEIHRAAGWRVAHIAGAHGRAQVLRATATALRFPAHFGHNLDALWDCLTDLTEPTALVWDDWQNVAVEHPDDWAGLLGVFRDRAAQDPPFALLLTDPSV